MGMEAVIEYRVPYADTDQMGVVYYANYLIYFEMSRAELMRNGGCSYTEFEREGFALPVIEAVCRYKSSAHYEDLLEVHAKVVEAHGVRVKIECRVMRGEELLAEGYTWHVCVNSSGRPVALPQKLKAMAGDA